MLFKTILVFWFLVNVAFAETKPSFFASLSFNNLDSDQDKNGYEDNPAIGIGGGFRALMGINDQLFYRSGAGIIQKRAEYEIKNSTTKGDATVKLIYFVIPLTLYWRASQQVGFFGGTALNAKLSDDCDGTGDLDDCNVEKDNALVLPAIVGFDFSFNDRVGMEISYEYGLTDSFKDTKIHSAVASFLIHF